MYECLGILGSVILILLIRVFVDFEETVNMEVSIVDFILYQKNLLNEKLAFTFLCYVLFNHDGPGIVGF